MSRLLTRYEDQNGVRYQWDDTGALLVDIPWPLYDAVIAGVGSAETGILRALLTDSDQAETIIEDDARTTTVIGVTAMTRLLNGSTPRRHEAAIDAARRRLGTP